MPEGKAIHFVWYSAAVGCVSTSATCVWCTDCKNRAEADDRRKPHAPSHGYPCLQQHVALTQQQLPLLQSRGGEGSLQHWAVEAAGCSPSCFHNQWHSLPLFHFSLLSNVLPGVPKWRLAFKTGITNDLLESTDRPAVSPAWEWSAGAL